MTITIPDIPEPVGAIEVTAWKHDGGLDKACRKFWGRAFELHSDAPHIDSWALVQHAGIQWADGRVKRWIAVDTGRLTPRDAREVARVLLAATVELEWLNRNEPAIGAPDRVA